MIKWFLACVFAFFYVVPWAWSATYYVGKSGSDANSCATATSSVAGNRKLTINAGKGCLGVPGDVVIVGDGTYVEGEVDMTVAGTSVAPMTIKAENKQKAILSSTSGNTCAPNISFNASYQVIDGIRGEIDSTDPFCTPNSATGAFVRMWATNNPTLGGNESTGYVGGVVRNSYVSKHVNRSVGIKCNQDNCLMEDNTVHSSIECFNAFNPIIRRNTLSRGDNWGTMITCKGGARNALVYNNFLALPPEVLGSQPPTNQGLALGGNSSCCMWDITTYIECYNCFGFNNIVLVEFGIVNGSGLALVGTKNSGLFNNVVIGINGGGTSFNALGLWPGGSGGTPQPSPDLSTIKNNIFGSLQWCMYSGSATNTTLDYNDFYSCNGGTPAQTNPRNGAPLYVINGQDFHLQSGSPARNTGTPIGNLIGYNGETYTVPNDAEGNPWTGSPSLGVYEYGYPTQSGGDF